MFEGWQLPTVYNEAGTPTQGTPSKVSDKYHKLTLCIIVLKWIHKYHWCMLSIIIFNTFPRTKPILSLESFRCQKWSMWEIWRPSGKRFIWRECTPQFLIFFECSHLPDLGRPRHLKMQNRFHTVQEESLGEYSRLSGDNPVMGTKSSIKTNEIKGLCENYCSLA